MVDWQRKDDVMVWEAPEGVQAWFSTRRGGMSPAPWASMNLSYGVGDDAVRVRENRGSMLEGQGGRLDQLVMAEQIHGGQVDLVGLLDRGRGAEGRQDAVEGSDGLLTQDSDVVLGMGFADCVPIFLADERANWAGLLHAGWRGTVAGIGPRAVQRLESLSVPPESLWVALGPSIGRCCYEVDRRVYDQVSLVIGEEPMTPAGVGHWMLDLALANRRALERAGVPAHHIADPPYCTSCEPDLFFSYRRDHGVTGRMGGYICLKGRR